MSRSGRALAAALALACAPSSTTRLGAQDLAIVDVTVVDVLVGAVRPGTTVLVSDGRITAVGSAAAVRVPPGVHAIDGRGRYLIPGLWDMHVHLSLLEPGSLGLFVANGVLGVREMGGRTEEVLRWRHEVSAGRLVGPRIVAPGPVVESPEWLDTVRRVSGARDLQAERIGVASAADAAAAVDSTLALGADFLKVRTNASREAYFALAREARARGLPLAGHAPRAIGPAEASDSGHASFEHAFLPTLDGMSIADRAALFRRFRDNGTAVTPTLIAGRNHRLLPDIVARAVLDDSLGILDPRLRSIPPRLVRKWREERELASLDRPRDWDAILRSQLRDVSEMQRAGVRILAGTDFGVQLVLPGWGLHEELALLVEEAGLSPADALRGATLAPAEFLGRADRSGTIEEGMDADLVLLDGDPFRDIRNVGRIRAVVHGGRLLDRASLDRLLDEAERVARGSRGR